MRERLALRSIPETISHSFYVLSCTRNQGEVARKCLQSVYDQDYDRGKNRHVFIDDDSTDDTREIVRRWLSEHPDHNVLYVRNETRLGGTRNTLRGFVSAPPGSVCIELNGDDWLPDDGVVSFLNRVYNDPSVWMTYNSWVYSDGTPSRYTEPIPEKWRTSRSYRRHPWRSSHLHTFRQELFTQIRKETMIDPETGEYWKNADDLAMYFAMLEMSGRHARHLYRITYVYNMTPQAELNIDRRANEERAARIRSMEPYPRLEKLVGRPSDFLHERL